MTVYYSEFASPIGSLTLFATEEGLCRIAFSTAESTLQSVQAWLEKFHITAPFFEDEAKFVEVKRQLNEYFLQQRTQFQLQVVLFGTEFQKRVWQQLERIPYGETCTYKDVAHAIHLPKGARAIGHANNRNPLPIVIPCHRVIGANRSLVGYAGGLAIKERLLQLERSS